MWKSLRYAVAALVAVCVVGALWLLRMQNVVLVLDMISTERLEAKALPDFAWNDLYLVANGHMLDLSLPDKPAVGARVQPDSGSRLMLVDHGTRVPLGRRTRSVIDNAHTINPAPVFALERGDRLSLSVERSWLDWPSFFTMNFMTGNSPTWRRYRYYRLVLQKAPGQTVDMLWRYEEFYYASDGWVAGDRLCEDDEPPCGLIRVRISPD